MKQTNKQVNKDFNTQIRELEEQTQKLKEQQDKEFKEQENLDKELKKIPILEQDINCKFGINEEVIIVDGLYRNNHAIIENVYMDDGIRYNVKLKILKDNNEKILHIGFSEERLKKNKKFRLPFMKK